MVGTDKVANKVADKVKVFISYSRTDRAFVNRLAGELIGHGIEVLLDTEDILVLSADGTDKTLLGVQVVKGYPPIWSPDSARIAFTSCGNGKGTGSCASWDQNAEVYVIGVDGSNLTRLTNDPAFDAVGSWSR